MAAKENPSDAHAENVDIQNINLLRTEYAYILSGKARKTPFNFLPKADRDEAMNADEDEVRTACARAGLTVYEPMQVKKAPVAKPKADTKKLAARIAVPSETKVGDTFIATNGTAYKLIAPGKVRKLFPDLPTDSELESLDTGSAKDRNNALFMLLRAEAPDDTVWKGDKANGKYIHCKGYKMRYTNEGFEILDGHNFYKPAKGFKVDADSPREVADWILNRTADRLLKDNPVSKEISKSETPKAKNNAREEVRAEEQQRERKIAELKGETPDKSLEELRKEALDLVEQARSGDLKSKEFIETIADHVPFRSLKVRIGKLIRPFQKKEIRFGKLLTQIQEVLETISFDTRKPAPKFLGIEFYELRDIRMDKDETVVVTLLDGSRVYTTNAEFLARYVLSKEPKLMPLLMKVAQGQEFDLEELQEAEFLVKDKYEEYVEKRFDKKVNQSGLDLMCREILAHWQEGNPLNWVYATPLKKGDKIRVEHLDHFTYYIATVTSVNEGPVRVRYEDGTVMQLYKHQPVRVL